MIIMDAGYKMRLRDFYNSHASTYNERHDNLRTRYMRRIEGSIIEKFAHGRILDIGCGTGNNMAHATAGVDISSEMLKHARKKGFENLVHAGAEEMPFKSGSFDTVLCTFTVINLCDRQKTVKEMRRILKKGGIAIVSASSVWDNARENFFQRLPDKASRFMKMRIEGFRFKFFGFSKSDFIRLFSGFDLRHFYGAYIIAKPFWGWHRDFSLGERITLRIAFALERLLQPFNRAARMYFGVFRKV